MLSRASTAMEDLLKPTIVLKPHPPKVLAKPAILQPLMILAREYLPLSFLDLSSPTGDLHPSRFYESHIRILDLESRRGTGPHLLIARLDAMGPLFAVEQHERSLYTACKLGDWVHVDQLASKATIACRQLLELSKKDSVEQKPSQHLTTPALHKAQNKKRLAIEALQSVVRKKARTQPVSTLPTLSESDLGTSVASDSRQETPGTELSTQNISRQESLAPEPEVLHSTPPCEPEPLAPPTGDELCDRIRKQYSEALYRSRGSLAYFPKGTLSRARAAFHLDSDSTLNMTDLVDFLKSLVMTMSQINKKYQETIPNIIKEMKTRVESSDEGKSKKRRARKMKLGRNGLYPDEEEQIRAWWTSSKPDLKDGEATIPESQTKSYVALLRIRETQLQMILILEILALEPLAATDNNDADSQLPGVGEATNAKPVKTKKGRDLADAVDMHADLLCIWQSTSSSELRLLEDSQVTDHSREGQKAQRSSSEPLRDFCTDIIMPFFHARLPEVCESLNRKLGGPVIPSPPKARQPKPKPKPKVPPQQPKPGSAAKRLQPSRPTSVRRALSNEQAERARRSMSRGPSKAVAALLSATETVISGIKREASDPLNLASIPRKKSDFSLLKDRSTNILSRSSSFGNSEDLKLKRKALVEAELQDAISALRKPNRQLAGKVIVEAAEKRASGSLSQLRKGKKPVRLTEQVQVKATPMNNRYRHAETQPVRPFSSLLHSGDDIPPSSASVIPATAPRGGFRDALAPSPAIDRIQATPARPQAAATRPPDVFARSPAADRVTATPARPLAASTKNGLLDVFTPARPVTSSTPADAISATPPIRNIKDMFRTPVKLKAPLAPLAPPPMVEQGEKKKSVYETLGWDNDFDDL